MSFRNAPVEPALKWAYSGSSRSVPTKNRCGLCVVGCALWVVGKSRDRASRVRFAHEKTRAKIGTDDSPHVCPIFRACDTLDPKPAARVSPSLPLSSSHSFGVCPYFPSLSLKNRSFLEVFGLGSKYILSPPIVTITGDSITRQSTSLQYLYLQWKMGTSSLCLSRFCHPVVHLNGISSLQSLSPLLALFNQRRTKDGFSHQK